MKLEDLVPPLEMCKRIPEGAFADSALVWLRESGHSGSFYIAERNDYLDRVKRIPAPTLEEILRGLTAGGLDEPAAYFDGDKWIAYYEYHNSGGPMTPITSSSGAAAALRLWLQDRGIGE